MELKEFVICHQKCMKRIQHELKEPTLDPEQLLVLMNDYTKVSNQLRRATEDQKRMRMSVRGGQIQRMAKTIVRTRTFRWDILSLCIIIHGIVICSFFTLNKKKSALPRTPEKTYISDGGDEMDEDDGEGEEEEEEVGLTKTYSWVTVSV